MHFFLLVLFVVGVIVMTRPYEANNDNLVKLSFFNDVEIDDSQPDIAVIRGKLAQSIPRNQSVLIYADKVSVQIAKNGYPVFMFTADSERKIMKEMQYSQWLRFYSPGILPSDKLTVILKSQKPSGERIDVDTFLDNMYMGDKYALISNAGTLTILRLVNGFVLVVLGLLYTLSLLVLRLANIKLPQRYHACGLLLTCAGICTLLDYKISTLIFKNVLALTFVDQLMQLVMCELMLIYFAEFLKSPVRRNIVQGMVYCWMLVSIAYAAISLTGVMGSFDYIGIFSTLSAILIVVTLVLLATESKPKETDLYTQLLLLSGIILSLTGLSSAIVFYDYYEIMPIIYQIGVVIFVVLQYIIFINQIKSAFDLIRKADDMEREIKSSKMQILSSQIQPHFMYNTLTSISALCDRNAAEAKEAVQNFARFLRGNLDSLSQKEMIPFSREIEHVRAYLSLEQMRYGDYLKVSYDIEEDNFTIPPLTIQPIVENAVKYGVGKKEAGGTVSLKTRRVGDNVEITVSDDGVGFILRQHIDDDGRKHVGIDNVKARLEAMCDGKLSIASTLGAGTTVTMTMPYDRVKLQ